MPANLSPEILDEATQAAAPILFAGALDKPTVNATKATAALKRLGIPTDKPAIIAFAYDGCGTHDFLTLEKAAKANNAKLYIVYGDPDGPGVKEALAQNKLTIGVTDHGKSRPLDARIILAPAGENLSKLAGELGLVTQSRAGSISSGGSALYDKGAFRGILSNGQTTLPTPEKRACSHEKRNGIALG